MLAHTTLLAAVFDRAHLPWIATPAHLGYKAIIIESLVAQMHMFELLPVLGTDLFEDLPVPQRVLPYHVAPSWDIGSSWDISMFAV
jgi:hypothetical protein